MRYFATRIPAALIALVLGLASVNLLGEVWAFSSEERAVLAVEREYVRAHVERDVAALDRVLADDFSMFRGTVNKEHRLAFISNPLFVITALKTGDVQVVVDGNHAIVTGTARLTGSFRGREINTPRYGYVRHFDKRNGRWQIVSVEFTLPW
jgi:ketosteroid isomerase-like protein